MKLYRFQQDGAAWLQDRKRAYLADAPGLGKTVQVIQALKAYGYLHPTVICPASAVAVWRYEAERWNLSVPLEIISYDSYVRNYDVAREHIRLRSDVIICDEAHYLKSTTAQRTNKILGAKQGLVIPGTTWWLLSGTPTPNHYGELFTVLAALWPEVLINENIRTYGDFLDEFAVWKMVSYGNGPLIRKVIRSKNGPKLKYLLAENDIMLRRTLEEVEVQLPGIFWQDVPVEVRDDLSDDERAAALLLADKAEALLAEGEAKYASERKRIGMRKAPGVASQVIELLEQDPQAKQVVMAYHHSVLDYLEEVFQRWGVVRVDGTMSSMVRGERARAFQTHPSVRVFLGQSVACREAITLTAAAMIHITEPEWTPEYNIQLAGRIRRLTQQAEHVIARMYFACDDPLDAALTRVIVRKAQDMDALYA